MKSLFKTGLAAAAVICLCAAAAPEAAELEQNAAPTEPAPWWKALWDRLSFKGFIETAQSVRTTGNHKMTDSFTRGRMEMSGDLPWFSFLVSGEAEANYLLEGMNGVRLREAWVEHDGNHWDVRAGRQLIVWGRADGLRITDNISPPDYTDMVLRGVEDTHKPVTAMKLRGLYGDWTAEFIWKPLFEPLDMPDEGGPWAIYTGFERIDDMARRMVRGSHVVVDDDENHKGNGLSDSEFAFKITRAGAGMDISLSYFNGWDNMPTFRLGQFQMGDEGPELHINRKHYRVSIYGLDIAVPYDAFVFRGEAALISGRRFYRNDMSLKNGDLLKYLVGFDWIPGSGWTVTGQFADDFILGYSDDLAQDQHKPLVTLSLSKQFLHDTLRIKEQLFTYLHDGQTMNRVYAEYDIADNWKISAGYDYFSVDNDSYYKNFGNNNQVWMKLRWSF